MHRKKADSECELIRLNNSQRPLWGFSVDECYALYCVFGNGADCRELRIVSLGQRNTEELPDHYNKLLRFAGEQSDYQDSEVNVEEAKKIHGKILKSNRTNSCL